MKKIKRAVSAILAGIVIFTAVPVTVSGGELFTEEVISVGETDEDLESLAVPEGESGTEDIGTEKETDVSETASPLEGKEVIRLTGKGTEDSPYQISSVNELAGLSELVEGNYEKYGNACYIVTEDIDGADYGESLKPIGSEKHPFAGTFNGNGKIISNFEIGDVEKDYQGLFGYVGSKGYIFNVGLSSIKVVANRYAGGIAGYVLGKISNSYFYGEIETDNDLHGLFGQKEQCASIENGYCVVKNKSSLYKIDENVNYYFFSEDKADEIKANHFVGKLNDYIVLSQDKDLINWVYNAYNINGDFPLLDDEKYVAEDKKIQQSFINSIDEEAIVGGQFNPRYSAPSKNDFRYYSNTNPFTRCGYGMPNCTTYAWGRAYEILGRYPNLPLGNAYDWYKTNRNTGAFSYGTTPKLGAIACWGADGSGNGHVAVVEAIQGNRITISESGWGWKEFNCQTRTTGTNYGGRPFQGYIYLLHNTDIPTAPSKPSINYSSTAGRNTNIQISCSASGTVTGYKAKVTDVSGNEICSTSGASPLVIKIPETGNYKLHVWAMNNSLASGETVGDITVKEDVKVTFADWNGDILKNETSIPYGSDAVAPAVAERTGYNFKGWSSSTTAVKEDTLFTAQYTKKKYTVKFYLEDGVTLLSAQTVEYGDAAKEPEYPEDKLKTGYVFEAWSQKTDFVEGNMNVVPVIAWGNVYLPVVATITKAEKVVDPEDKNSIIGYTANIHMVCTPDSLTKGRAVVSLKTANGKMVASTESAAFYIFKDSQRDLEVFVPYEDVVTRLEVIIVDGYSLNTPYSKSVVYEIPDDTQEWSGWKEGTPDAGYREDQIEYRTEYSYRDKQFITTTNDAMTGWELLSESEGWSGYGNWSAWQDTPVSGSDTTKVETRSVVKTNAYTQYNYYAYNSYNSSKNYKWTHFCPVAARNFYGGTWNRCESGWTNTYVAPAGLGQNHGYGCSCGNHGGAMSQYSYGGWKYYYCQTRTIPATYKTQYRYATRTWQKNNTFWKWGDYTDWSPDAIEAFSNREVRTRRVYRTFGCIADMENPESITRTISGNLSPELAGKQLILMVYKVDEASDYSNEYVGQTMIEADGSYSFEFITREEPSVKTGDFTVALSIEGSTAPIYLESIKAPKPVYTVAFEDWNGNPIGEVQQVTEGDSAVSPEEPVREGYYFAGWDTGLNNVHYDMIVTAKYRPVPYTIIYKDWDETVLDIQQTGFGETLTPPALVGNAERSYTGWDIPEAEKHVVEGDMILTAQSVVNKYTVNFYQENKALIKSEEVEYGNSATPPDDPVRANSRFDGWSEDNAYTYVTGNLDLYPVFSYTDTTKAPTASVKSGIYSNVQEVSLSCETSGANIYYALNGADPEYEGILYSQPIMIDSDTELRAVATRLEMNDSEEVSYNYKMRSPLSITKCDIEEIPVQTYTGQAVTPEIIIKDNGKTLKEKEHYTVVYSNNIAVGAATAFISGTGLYEGKLEVDFCIVNSDAGKTSLAGAKIGKIKKVTYDGRNCRPSVSVKLNGRKLTPYIDYQVAYRNNVNAGTADAVIVGCGSYCGTKTVSFTILPAKIKSARVSGLDRVTALDGNRKEVEAVVSMEGQILKENEDYELSYKNNQKAGKATVIIRGIRNYKGSIKKRFNIGKVNINSLEAVSVYNGEAAAQEYTGGKIMPGVFLTHEGYELTEGKDYKIKYSDNVRVGVAKMVVKGRGNYDGQFSLQFSIVPRDLSNLWDITVCDVQYNGIPQEPSVKLRNTNAALKPDRDYYTVFSDNTDKGTATVMIYGKGNYTGVTTASFRIVERLINKARVSKIETQEYTGSAVSPDVVVELDGKTLTPEKDFIVTYQGNIEKGTATATVTGIHEYGGSRTVRFKIK